MSTTLYRLYDGDGRLLYVGITDNYTRRMVAHSEKSWWPEVRDAKLADYATRGEALAAESRAIDSEGPLHNRTGANRGRSRTGVAPVPSVAVAGWVTIQDAAEMLKVTPKTLRRMISRGDIEARRIGPKLIRVNADTLFTSAKPIGNWRG